MLGNGVERHRVPRSLVSLESILYVVSISLAVLKGDLSTRASTLHDVRCGHLLFCSHPISSTVSRSLVSLV